ncbi:MAG: D-alanine--D-alanine ligase [Bacteroidales bacterium]|jgi:D-alanine-D-alanine ligase|nr:D-alanine--D-alanine ligase [Bacteroidales bacterium]MDD4385075.1 D-alanine--D-alanine ligase [Bacteroidales bacterium]MDY0196386.1 D-alanine--D-alanine ligase [Tenuifilaceae bacterium]
MNSKLNIAIMAGGNSSEEGISLKGVVQIAKWLDPNKYNAFPVMLKGIKMTLKHPQHGDIPVSWDNFSAKVGDEVLSFDCALIAIHGTPGENGLLQGYLEMMKIPYTTGGVLNTALTFCKDTTKRMLEGVNVHLAKDLRVHKGTPVNPDDIAKKIGLPLFVKPNESGSSYGITKVKLTEEIVSALEKSFTEDPVALIEEFIPGVELTCGLVKTKNKSLVFPVTEIVPKNEYFDYGAKYENQVEEITPARIPDDLADYIQSVSSEIYDRLGCRGIVRIDYIYSNKKLYFLEVNTVPGMSEASIVPQQVAVMGLTMNDVFGMVIEDAIAGKTK